MDRIQVGKSHMQERLGKLGKWSTRACRLRVIREEAWAENSGVLRGERQVRESQHRNCRLLAPWQACSREMRKAGRERGRGRERERGWELKRKLQFGN